MNAQHIVFCSVDHQINKFGRPNVEPINQYIAVGGLVDAQAAAGDPASHVRRSKENQQIASRWAHLCGWRKRSKGG